MTEVLTVRIKEIQRRFPTWSPDQYLRGRGNPGSALSRQGTIGTNVIHVPDSPRPLLPGEHEERESKLTAEHPEATRAVGQHESVSPLQVGSVPTSEGPAMSEAARTWAVTSAMMSLHEPNTSRDTASNTSDQPQGHSDA